MYYGKFQSFKRVERSMFRMQMHFINNGMISMRFIKRVIGTDF